MSERFPIDDKQGAEYFLVELNIVEPRGDKNFMVAFEGSTDEETFAYNVAIESVLKKHGLQPFHQVGVTPAG